MDDNQCRVCLGDANDNRLSLFKRVNGILIQEKLEFVTGIKVSKIQISKQTLNSC